MNFDLISLLNNLNVINNMRLKYCTTHNGGNQFNVFNMKNDKNMIFSCSSHQRLKLNR